MILSLLAVLSIGGLVPLLINLIVVGLIIYLLWWLIGYIGLPAPFDRVARVIVAVVAVIFLINLLLSLTGRASSLGNMPCVLIHLGADVVFVLVMIAILNRITKQP